MFRHYTRIIGGVSRIFQASREVHHERESVLRLPSHRETATMREDIVIIGGGLAGSEAAWQAANRGAKVTLYEMRPKEQTAAHKTGYLAELVCSNSLGSRELQSAPGLLQEEMRPLGSLNLQVADDARVPAGAALAVDRDLFAQQATQALDGHPNIRILREPVAEVPSDCLAIEIGRASCRGRGGNW